MTPTQLFQMYCICRIFVFVKEERESSFFNAHKTFSGETGCLRLFAGSFAGTDFKEADVFLHSERGLRV